MPTLVSALPHLIIPSVRFTKNKKESRRFVPPPSGYSKEERESASEGLIDSLDSVLESNKRYSETGLTNCIFKLTTRNELNLVSTKPLLERIGLTWLNPLDKTSVVVSVSPGKAEELKTRFKEYGEKEKYKSYFDNFSRIEPITDKNRLSVEFAKHQNDEKIKADIRFYSGLSLEEYTKSVSFIQKLMGKDKILIQNTDGLETPFARIACSVAEAIKLADLLPTIKKIGPTPKFVATATTPREAEEVIFDPAPEDLKVVMVIDSGINHEHNGIRNVLITRKSYVPNNSDTSDLAASSGQAGHGTSVAGLAAYGVMQNTRRQTPTSKIGVAKIWDGNHEDKSKIESMLENIVKDGVEKGIRIYSLTTMYQIQAAEISELAFVIDKLSREYNILFTVATGNIAADKIEEYHNNSLGYPKYFGREDSRIYCGAEACCAITVGGIASTESNESIARRMQASPFTRAGPTPDGRLKPDLVHFAGNVNNQFDSTEDLGVLSLNYKPSEGVYSVASGTSFCTPIVANMASQVLKEYPNASANLIRALLIHSGKVLNEFMNVNEPRFVYGFGFPDLAQAKHSTSFTPTMLFEGELDVTEKADIKVPVPRELSTVEGSKFVKITLTYDPPVTYQNKELNYSLLDLSFKIIRSNDGSLSRVSGSDTSWITPHLRRTENNTVKKDTFQWTRGRIDDWVIEITPHAKADKKSLGKQRFALVVTIEDARKQTDLYSPIKALFEAETIKAVATTQLIRPQAVKRSYAKSG